MLVLIDLLVVIHTGLAVLVDQAELELVKMVGAKSKLAGGMFAAVFLAHAGAGFRLLLVAHELSVLARVLWAVTWCTKLLGISWVFFSKLIGKLDKLNKNQYLCLFCS